MPPSGAQPRAAGLTGSGGSDGIKQWHSGDMEQFSPMKGKINDTPTNSPLGLANTQVPKNRKAYTDHGTHTHVQTK